MTNGTAGDARVRRIARLGGGAGCGWVGGWPGEALDSKPAFTNTALPGGAPGGAKATSPSPVVTTVDPSGFTPTANSVPRTTATADCVSMAKELAGSRRRATLVHVLPTTICVLISVVTPLGFFSILLRTISASSSIAVVEPSK